MSPNPFDMIGTAHDASDAPDTQPAPVQPGLATPHIDVAKRLEQFLKLRETVDAIAARHKAELEPFAKIKARLEADLMTHFAQSKTTNVAVKGLGTAYLANKVSATIADPLEFKRHVIGGQLWDMVDWKANAPAVTAAIARDNAVPPGINYSVFQTVNVRTASEAAKDEVKLAKAVVAAQATPQVAA